MGHNQKQSWADDGSWPVDLAIRHTPAAREVDRTLHPDMCGDPTGLPLYVSQK
ncbi:hypothetical protein [Dietzia psychralcaliphila]|uniref:hypothetical protein n=1 Tax=Dietzia psychralcaliphila TaxID=139021 RepID=UPI001C1E3A98|nr:hypothetical protein [Dietzia psychralcaliphila]